MQANALAHARIRELEARVLELESECAEHKLAAGRQSAHVRCLEYTLECVRVGWETMAHALRDCGVRTPLAARERATSALPTPPQPPSRSHIVLQDDRPTTRVPAAYATPLASEFIAEVSEDMSPLPETPTREAWTPSQDSTPRVASPLRGDTCPISVTRRTHGRRQSTQVDDVFRLDANDSAGTQHVGDDGDMQFEEYEQLVDPVSEQEQEQEQGQGQEQECEPVFAMDMEHEYEQEPFVEDEPIPEHEHEYEHEHEHDHVHQHESLHEGESESHPTSNTGSGSDSRSEMDDQLDPSMQNLSSHDTKQRTTPSTPPHPQPKRSRRTSIMMDPGLIDEVPDRTRRARKSINYALPKLNTKMRKPDPDESDAPDAKKPRTSQERRRSTRTARQVSSPPPPPKTSPNASVNKSSKESKELSESKRCGDVNQQHENELPPDSSNTGTQHPSPAPSTLPPATPPQDQVQHDPEPNHGQEQDSNSTIQDSPVSPLLTPKAAPTPRRPRRSRAAEPTRRATPQVPKQRAGTPTIPPSVSTASARPTAPAFQTRSNKPFVPSRGGKNPHASVLQQHSAQKMPNWASSLLHLSSPEPPSRQSSQQNKENCPERPRRPLQQTPYSTRRSSAFSSGS